MKKLYNTSSDLPPTRAVVKSQLAAEREAKTWSDQKLIKEVTDLEGSRWKITIRREEDYLHNRAQKPFGYIANISLLFTANRASLLEHNILNQDEDFRLLELFGDHSLPIELKAYALEGTDQRSLDEEIRARLDSLAKDMPQKDLRALKRKFVADWVDQSRRFQLK